MKLGKEEAAAIDVRLAAGRKLADEKKLEEAHAIYKAVTEEYPGVLAGWMNLGCIEDEMARQTGGLFGGKDAFARALAIRHVPEVMNDMANILLRNELRWQEAEKFYREAVIRFGFDRADENLAVCLLNAATVKRTPEGWREAWQWFEKRRMNTLRGHQMFWRGESLKDQSLLIKFEQGFGDHLWGFRFVKQAKAEGAKTICLVPPNTIRLAIAQPYVDEVYNDAEPNEIESDFATMLMSMPGLMLPNSMPRTAGRYVETGIEPDRHSKPRVGLCWAGSVDAGYQSWRNIDVRLLKPLFDMRPDIEFVSLQRGKHEHDAPELPLKRSRILAAMDLWDTAQLVESCDLVITTDTLVPHMAASLGIETWLLDRYSSCWQWGIGGPETDPHWYETLSIYRQPEFFKWEPVVETITEKLRHWRR